MTTFTLRLTDEEAEALRATATAEHRSMNEVARTAIVDYTSGRVRRRDEHLERIMVEDAALLDRLAAGVE